MHPLSTSLGIMPKATSHSGRRNEAQPCRSCTACATRPSIQRSRIAASRTSSRLPRTNLRMGLVPASSTASASSDLDPTTLQHAGIQPTDAAVPPGVPLRGHPLSRLFKGPPPMITNASSQIEDMHVPPTNPRRDNQDRQDAVLRSRPTQVDESCKSSHRSVSRAAPASSQASSTITNNKLNSGGDMNIYTAGGDITVYKDTSGLLLKLNNILKPVDAAWNSYQANQRSKCFPNTRTQLLKDIQKWTDGDGSPAPIYVLDGVAGIGKSTVAQTIAEQAAALGILGASFFFTMNEEERMTAKYFFPTIAFHLARHNTAFAQQLNCALEQDPDAAQKTIHQQVSLLLVNPLRDSSIPTEAPILMVIDALDECRADEAHTLLTLLAHYIPQIPQLRLFITARPEEHLRRILTKDKNHELFHLHGIDDEIVQSDIRLYLEHSLSVERVQELFPDREPPWQPNASEMLMLCGICGTLFIIASTATKFILDTKAANPGSRLSRLLEGVSLADYSGSKRTDVMDKFYIRIIHNAAPDDMDEVDGWFEQYRTIVGAIIVLQNPLPCGGLAQLLNLQRAEVINGLLHLHSLVAPSGPHMVFRVHHKSFPDFITNPDRIERALATISATTTHLSPKFLINPRIHHHQLAAACFRIMEKSLKFNIGNISPEAWFLDKADIVSLHDGSFGEELTYAVSHWALHIHAAGGLDGALWEDFRRWASTHIMAWLEVMSILGQIRRAHDMLDMALDSIAQPNSRTERNSVHTLLSDTRRLLLQNVEVVTSTPMHIYSSALPFVPRNSVLYSIYGEASCLSIVSGIEGEWDPAALVTMTGHAGGVNAVAFSPNGKMLASGSADTTIRLWDGNTGGHIITLEGHSGPVSSVTFSPAGAKFASASLDHTIRLWDITTGAHIITLGGHSEGVYSIAFSPDGSRLASGANDNTVRLWDGTTGAHLITLEGHLGLINSITFSPDGSTLASASDDHTIWLWDATTTTHTFTLNGHFQPVETVTFSPDGSRLASASNDHTIRLWDAATGAHIITLEGHSKGVYSVAFSPNGLRLASASFDKTVRLWDGTTGVPITAFNGHSNTVFAVAFSPDGSRLASGSFDRTIRLWDVRTDTKGHFGEPQLSSNAFLNDRIYSQNPKPDNPGLDSMHTSSHLKWVTDIAHSPDGSRFVSGSQDTTLQMWDGRTGAHIITLSGHSGGIKVVTFSPDGSRLASGFRDQTIRLWDGKTGDHICTLEGHSRWVMAISFSPDGSKLASASDDMTIKLWDGMTGTHIFTLNGHSDYVHAIAFSPDGSRLVSASDDMTFRVWDGESGCHITTIGVNSAMKAIAFSPAGSTVVCIEPEDLDADNSTLYLRAINNVVRPISLGKYFRWIKSFTFLPSAPPSIAPNDVVDPLFTQPITSDYPLRIIALGRRQNPALSGLVYLSIPADGDSEPVIVPFCWFPHHFNVIALSVDASGSSIAVGCGDGRVLLIDISRVYTSVIAYTPSNEFFSYFSVYLWHLFLEIPDRVQRNG